MISMKCKNCGGEMSVDGSGNLYCNYCGTKSAFRDDELLAYKNFRLQVLNYLRGVHDQKADGKSNEELLWANAETKHVRLTNGADVTIRYIYENEGSVATTYLTRNNIIYLFKPSESKQAGRMLDALADLQYPAADVKNLNECFPKLAGRYELEGGGVLVAFERPDNVFPLAMFGSLEPEHVAWIVSRMENICCVLEYSDLVHSAINEDAVFINPFVHHAILFGEWWRAYDRLEVRGVFRNPDLRGVRETAKRVLGIHLEEAPEQFRRFLDGAPAADAYQDFERWDRVIEEGFGGRRFAKMKVDFE